MLLVSICGRLLGLAFKTLIAILSDETELAAHIDGDKVVVTIIGTSDSLAECGQQLAWLGAALRSSPFPSGVTTCIPSVRKTSLDRSFFQEVNTKSPTVVGISCVIDFELYQSTLNVETLPGHCWHNMFRNPVMVCGYPIPAKNSDELGLEIPINMMAMLAGSDRAIDFDRKIFIKGFTTMLIATKVTKDLLLWHYLYKSNGERISNADHNLHSIEDSSLTQLNTPRYVVGWCSDCRYFAGEFVSLIQLDASAYST